MDIIFLWKIIGTFLLYLVFLDPFNRLLESLKGDKSLSSNIIRLVAFIVWAASTSILTYFIWWH